MDSISMNGEIRDVMVNNKNDAKIEDISVAKWEKMNIYCSLVERVWSTYSYIHNVGISYSYLCL